MELTRQVQVSVNVKGLVSEVALVSLLATSAGDIHSLNIDNVLECVAVHRPAHVHGGAITTETGAPEFAATIKRRRWAMPAEAAEAEEEEEVVVVVEEVRPVHHLDHAPASPVFPGRHPCCQ